MSEKPLIPVLCKDLFFGSQIHGGLARAGYRGQTCLSQEAASPLLEKSPDWVVIDLEFPGLDLPGLLKACPGETRTIAFGPHVRTDLFAMAEEAGVQSLLTRGQASAQLEAWLQQH